MCIKINSVEFQQSTTIELDVIKNRVRNLIGSRHWGEDGRYKETILKKVLKTRLPNLSIGTGFIVNEAQNVSKQIDIIIYDETIHEPFFKEEDFVIVPNNCVKGIIEVKSKIHSSAQLKSILGNFDSSIESVISQEQQSSLFLGLFAYDSFNIMRYLPSIRGILGLHNTINHIALGCNIFIRKWKDEDRINLIPPIQQDEQHRDFYNIYNMNNLAYSYFISNAIYKIHNRNEQTYSSIDFPIPGTKETTKIETINIIRQ